MTNLEIDEKLAKAMGIKVHVTGAKDLNRFRIFHPTTQISDAWEVFTYFDFDELSRSLGIWFVKRFDEDKTVEGYTSISATMAICKAALKVIENQEGSKNDE